jgi:cysteine desulfurase
VARRRARDEEIRGMTYLDYQATAPLAPEALEAMLPWLETQHANPHSAHREGRAARAAVEVARDHIAALFPASGRIAFTSGATEALNWAIQGTSGDIVTIATEHSAVLATAAAMRARDRNVTVLPVGTDGIVDLDRARAAITPRTGLVAAMLVNNEIGVIQPVGALAEMAHTIGALLLCDAVQGYGRVPIPATCDLVAISAHKVHGPKGIGALWLREGVAPQPLLHGGDQEAGRSGTLSPALCAGFGAAATLMAKCRDVDAVHVGQLFSLALDRLDGWHVNGSVTARYRGNINIRRDRLDVGRLMSELRDIAFSAGSACASGSGRASPVLRAIGLSGTQARNSIRLGFGRYTDPDAFVAAIDRIAAAAERIAA